MIDPLKVLVSTPTHDGNVCAGYAGGLMSVAAAHMLGNVQFIASVSHVGLARDLLVHKFLSTNFEWLVFIDADTGFSSRDFAILMDYPERNHANARDNKRHRENNPEGTTETDDGHALIVCAEYSRKVDTLDPATFGLGFCRIHRSVFEKLAASVEEDGKPRLGQFFHRGEMYTEYFPSGPAFDGIWLGEDGGFFHLCRLTGITPRIERRTALVHYGLKAYPYSPQG
jgi:hypothetical protein